LGGSWLRGFLVLPWEFKLGIGIFLAVFCFAGLCLPV
jgi:hypothetical protein